MFKDEQETVGESNDSIAWAEKNLGSELKLPEKEKQEMVRPGQRLQANQDAIEDIDFDDDDEIKSTLKSAHQAEWLYGYHGYGQGNYTGGHTYDGYGNYTNGVGFGNGTYGRYNYGGNGYGYNSNNWRDWYKGELRKEHNGTEEYGWYGYGGYGGISHQSWGSHGHDGWRCNKPKNLEWWKTLTKDNGHEGMVTTKTHDHAKDFWVNREFKHEADIYCDEWQPIYWNSAYRNGTNGTDGGNSTGNATEGGNSTEGGKSGPPGGDKPAEAATEPAAEAAAPAAELPAELQAAPVEKNEDKATDKSDSKMVPPELVDQEVYKKKIKAKMADELKKKMTKPKAADSIPPELRKQMEAAA